MLFAFDLDRTLLNSEATISDTNTRTLQLIHDLGHKIAFVSGRPFMQMTTFLKNYNFIDYLSPNNGVGVYKVSEKKFLDLSFLPEDDIVRLIDFSQQHKTHMFIVNITDMHEFDLAHPEDNYFTARNNQLENIKKLSTQGTRYTQLSMYSSHINIKNIERTALKIFPHLSIVISNNYFLDVNPANTSKANAVERICKYEQIGKNEVFVFGDSENDISMLKKFENSYAMANSFPGVKEVAKHIIGNHNSDTISETILKIIKV